MWFRDCLKDFPFQPDHARVSSSRHYCWSLQSDFVMHQEDKVSYLYNIYYLFIIYYIIYTLTSLPDAYFINANFCK